jgi:hypothetical protein
MVTMGALTSKIYSFEARPWELRKERGIDPFEGKEILFEMRGLTILRAFPREGWISDKIRIILDAFQFNRLLLPVGNRIFFFLFFRQENKNRKKGKRDFFFPIFYEAKKRFLLEEKKKRSEKKGRGGGCV